MMRKIKVMHIETGSNLYGGALQVVYLLEGLKQRQVENYLLCPKNSEVASAASPHARILDVPFKGDLDVRLLGHAYAMVKRIKPDLVHIHSRRGADIWGGLGAKLAGVPVILTRRVDNPESRYVVAIKSRMYDRILTISEFIRGVLIDEGAPAHKVFCVRSAIDPGPYQGISNRDWFCREFDVPPQGIMVGVIAQLIQRKGHRFVLQSLQTLLREHPHVYVFFFGKGPLKDELQSDIDTMGLSDHVTLGGFRSDLHRILPVLDLVVHPALMEGLGVSLIQASASGTPVIAFHSGGIPEIVRHDINGLLVLPEDTDGLTQAMDRVFRDSSLRKRLGDAGKHLVELEFSVAAMVEGNLNHYNDLISN